MEPKQREQLSKQLELSQKLQSIMAHPEWQMIVDLIEDERKFHSNKSLSTDYRNDPAQYGNIVRAMDSADAVKGILNKFDTILVRGREAKEKLDVADGVTDPRPR